MDYSDYNDVCKVIFQKV